MTSCCYLNTESLSICEKLTGLLVLSVGVSVSLHQSTLDLISYSLVTMFLFRNDWGGLLVCCSCFHIWMWSSRPQLAEPGSWAPSGPWSFLGGSFLATCRARKHCCGHAAVSCRPVASPLLWERLQSYLQGWLQFCAWLTCALLCGLCQEATGYIS